MQWEEAVKASPAKACYRILTDGRLSYVDVNGVMQTQTKFNDRFKYTDIAIQTRNRLKDWQPMPMGFMVKFNRYGLDFLKKGEPDSSPAPVIEDESIGQLKELFQKIGVDFQITIAPATKPAEAVIALADLASRWLDNGHQIQAAFVTQLLAQFML